jgi:(5-formylfuran-3-yl)methyl phosphate transaminase
MPQRAFNVFADASKWTENSYDFAFELLERAGVGVAPAWTSGRRGSGRCGSADARGRRC